MNAFFAEVPNRHMEENIRNMKLMPLRPDEVTDAEIIGKLVALQQKFLNKMDAIHLFNIRRVDWMVPTMKVTFRENLLNARHRGDNSALINTIEHVEDSEKILIVVEKGKKEYVKKWLKLVYAFLKEAKMEAFWKDSSGCDGIFSFEGRKKTKEQVANSKLLEMEIQCSADATEIESLSLSRSTKRPRERTIPRKGTKYTAATMSSTMGESVGSRKRQASSDNTNTRKTEEPSHRNHNHWGSVVTQSPNNARNSWNNQQTVPGMKPDDGTEELNQRLVRLEEREKEREIGKKAREAQMKAMRSLLYRVDDKVLTLDKDMEVMAASYDKELEVTREALGVLTVKLNEVAGTLGLETIEDIVEAHEEMSMETDEEENSEKQPMPAKDGLSGMEGE